MIDLTKLEIATEQLMKNFKNIECKDEVELNKLHEIMERCHQVVNNNAMVWIWEVDVNGKYLYVSDSVEIVLGYKKDEVVGKYFYDFFHPDDKEELKQLALAMFKKKQSFKKFLNRNVRKNGRIIYISTSGVPIMYENNLVGYRGMDIDITSLCEKLKEKWG